MTAREIIDIYISFFEKRNHKRIPNSPLVPENDPTTLFTSSGMQPLVSYLLGEAHPQGNRLVNVQNCFRAVDIDEVGDNRHTTFFRMLGNWSLGDYFKSEQLPWFFEFLTKELRISPERLYVSIFEGDKNIPRDESAALIWKEIFENAGLSSDGRISYCGVSDNWWSRSGTPENMPVGEIGGPDSEVYFDLKPDEGELKGNFKELSDSGRLLEIGNSVFIEYQKTDDGFKRLSQSNVDFGAGVERLLAAAEDKSDMFQTSLFAPIISSIEQETGKEYEGNEEAMRIITDHFVAASFLTLNRVIPGNKEQGYILRRLIRRGVDNLHKLGSKNVEPVLEAITKQYSQIDTELPENFVRIKSSILEETTSYKRTLGEAKKLIEKELAANGTKTGDELIGTVHISADLAFKSLASYGLGPTQLRSLGYDFNEQELAEKIKEHQDISRSGATKKFAGGLSDHSEQTIRGHTATHLLHQAIRDLLGNHIHQSGSNITVERVRFDYNFDRNLTPDEIAKLEQTVNEKIKENLEVFFEFMPLQRAKEIGAIGLFDEKYSDKVKIYLIGDKNPQKAYSKEFCGGPHVNWTSEVKSFKIIKQENIGNGLRRLYARVG